MKPKDFKYIYGPVPSWRLGASLGIDLLSNKEKLCSFDCIYCQLGKTRTFTTKRKLYIPTKKIVAEIKALPNMHIDYITFSGRGEPTLAKNLGETIKAIKRLRPEPIAVLTNSSLMYRKDVRGELALADLVAVKLDASSKKTLKLINQPAKGIKFSDILKGIKQFRKEYHGKLALQVMFMKKNRNIAKNIAKLVKFIHPDEVQINTPQRISPVRPLSRRDILEIKKCFPKTNVVSVYSPRHKKLGTEVCPISVKSTREHRGGLTDNL